METDVFKIDQPNTYIHIDTNMIANVNIKCLLKVSYQASFVLFYV